jgi:integrase
MCKLDATISAASALLLGKRRGLILHPDGVPIGTEINAVPSTCDPAAQSDKALIGLWFDGRSAHTRRAYRADARLLLAAAGKPIAALTLVDLQAWMGSLAGLAPASRARKIGAVKSLLSFGGRTGNLSFNVGAAVRVPPVKNILAERILEENDVIRLIALEPEPRNHALLRLGYIAGLRISELTGLRWRDAKRRAAGAGQIAVFGKGGKTRVIVLPASIWRELTELRGEAPRRRSHVPLGEGRRARPVAGPPHREASRGAGRPAARSLGALPAPRPRFPRARSRRASAPSAGDGRPQRSADHVSLRAR